MVGVQCPNCKNLNQGDGPLTCKAFPDGIPELILTGRVDHSQPYLGDNGILYDPIDKDIG